MRHWIVDDKLAFDSTIWGPAKWPKLEVQISGLLFWMGTEAMGGDRLYTGKAGKKPQAVSEELEGPQVTRRRVRKRTWKRVV